MGVFNGDYLTHGASMRFLAKVLVKAGPFCKFPSSKRDPCFKGNLQHDGQLGQQYVEPLPYEL